MNDIEKNAELVALQKKVVLFRTIAFVCFAITIASMFFDLIPVVFIAAIAMMIFFGLMLKYGNDIKSKIGSDILVDVLHGIFENIEYHQSEKISNAVIDSAGFGFSYDESSGNDHILATYKGLNVEMSDVKLIVETTDSDGETHRNTIFSGLWLICDFGKELSADVKVMERSKLGQVFNSKGGIQTENEAFNKQFAIKSENEEEAFYILTPHMMEYIVAMDKKANAKTYLSFLRNGKLHIALDSGKDAFEISTKVKNIDTIKEQFTKEIRQITGLIDELRITNTIYKK